MKPMLRRLAATVAVAVLVSMQTSGNAVADTEPQILRPNECRWIERTPDAAVPPRAWHLERLQMDTVWRLATGKGVVVAVIDTGVATAGTPFFSPERIRTFDYLGGMSDADKEARGMDCAHGTRVASLIAAARPDGRDVDIRTNFAGIAPDAEIVSYRVLSASEPTGKDGDPLDATIAAVRHATSLDVDVINLSQSVNDLEPKFDEFKLAVEAALDAGIVVVAAAGNLIPDAPVEVSYPGAFDGVISVGGSTRSDTAYARSRPGAGISLAAPGDDLMALQPSRVRPSVQTANQAYVSGIEGTSYAAPIVSGVVALMLELNPDLTPREVEYQLRATADPPPSTVPDSRLGYGIVNPLRALTAVPRPQLPNPGTDATVPTAPLPTREQPDMQPAVIAVSVGVGALVLAGVGLVAAVTIPAAVRRQESSR